MRAFFALSFLAGASAVQAHRFIVIIGRCTFCNLMAFVKMHKNFSRKNYSSKCTKDNVSKKKYSKLKDFS